MGDRKRTGSRVSIPVDQIDDWSDDLGDYGGSGGSLLEGYVPAPASTGGAGGRLLDTVPPSSFDPVAVSETMVPGVGPALAAGRTAIGQAAGAAGRMPGALVSEALGQAATGQAQRWDPATRGVGLPGPETAPMPPMTMRMASGSSSSSTSTTSPAISPAEGAGMVERMKAWSQLRQNANEQLGGIDARRLGDEEGIIRAQQAQVQKAQAAAAKQQAENAERMAAQRERLERIQESIKPNFDYYRGKWGGLRAMGDAIAIGLAGMGQAMMASANIRAGQPATLGPNPVLASIERAYERDMKGQLAEMADRKWKYEQGRNMLADLRRESGDIREALAQAKLAYLDEANLQVKMIRAKYGAEAAPWLRDIDDAGVGQAAEAQRLTVAKAMTAREVKTRESRGGYSTQVNPAWALRQKEEAKGPNLGARLPAKVADGVGAVEEFAMRLDKWGKEYLTEAQKPGHAASATLGGIWGSKARVLEVQKGGLIAELRKAREAGVMTDKDFDRYVARIPTLLDNTTTADAKIKALKSDISIGYGAKLRALGRAGYDVSRFPSVLGETK